MSPRRARARRCPAIREVRAIFFTHYGSYGFMEATPEPLDWELLQLLVDDFEHRPWTALEVVNRTGIEPAVTLASLERLHRGALVDWPHYWVAASQPAIYYSRIAVRLDGPTRWFADPV